MVNVSQESNRISAKTVGSDAPYLVVSADSHAGPSLERSLRPYCPAQYLAEFDDFVGAVRSGDVMRGARDDALSPADRMINRILGVLLKQRPVDENDEFGIMTSMEEYERHGRCPGHDDPHARLRDMDGGGVTAEVIFAGGANAEVLPFVGFGADAGPVGVSYELRAVGERIWNRWLAEFCSVAPERLIGVMQIPMWDVEAAIGVVEWGRDAGLGAVNLPAPRADYASYNDPIYEPFWSACEALHLPLVTHVGGGETPLGWDGPGGAAVFHYERLWLARRHLWQMIFSGVFERHPGLTLIFTEQRVAWVPETLRDLDNVYRAKYGEGSRMITPLPRAPSEYWASNCFNSGSFLAPFEVAMRHEVGLGNLLWGSDYPHPEGTWPTTKLAIRNTFADVPEHDVRLILGENAVRAFHLDETVLRPIADRVGPAPLEVSRPLGPGDPPAHRGFSFRQPYETF